MTASRREPAAPAEPAEVCLDPEAAAKAAGLRYGSDRQPGIHRHKQGDEWVYLDPKQVPVTDERTLARIASLAIPPAWTDVWISPHPTDHLQATGRDARGRKQYKYHPKWRKARDQTKYDKMTAFGEALPNIRQHTAADLKLPGLPKQKVLAAVVQLLEKTRIRVGNEAYVTENKHYGLTTLRNRHVKVRGSQVRFAFRGKSGVEHEIDLRDRKLARVVAKCQDLPGQELFEYLDAEGNVEAVQSHDVNEYLQAIAGDEFTAKDFRTWAGTVLTVRALAPYPDFASEAEAKRNVNHAIEEVARELGNTKTVCRNCYVHPAIIDAYLEGTLAQQLQVDQKTARQLADLEPDEQAILVFLRRVAAAAD